MKLKHSSYLALCLLMMQGCAIKQPKTSVADIQDVNLSVEKNGEPKLNITYKQDTNTSIPKDQNITAKEKYVQPYEMIPQFDSSQELSYSVQKKHLKPKVHSNDEQIKISFESIPVNEFIDVMFGDMLKLNYTISPNVQKLKNPITLNMTKSQSKTEVLNIVRQLLQLQQISVEENNGIYFIDQIRGKVNKKDDVLESAYIGYGRQVSSSVAKGEIISMIVPFYYIKPQEALDYFKLSGLEIEYRFPDQNLMMIKADRDTVKKAIEIVKLVDKNSLRSYKPYLMEFNYIDVDDFVTRMKTILEANNINIAEGRKKLGVSLTQVPEINALYILSPKQEWVELIAYWKEKLDIEEQNSLESQLYFYKVQNRKADELAKTIESILSMQSSSFSTAAKETPKNSEKTKDDTTQTKSSPTTTQSSASTTIQADLSTNTIILKTDPVTYRNLLPIIKQLDVLPLQVLAEVTLAEVTLTDTFNLGFEYALRNSDAASGLTSINPISAAFGGSGFAATYKSKYLDATINAYAEDKLLNILSKPKILILNNETGNINVGTQIPIVTSENSSADLPTTGTTSSIMRNITYRDTGVVVGVTPTINSNGVLTMSIDIQLSEAQLNDTSSIDSPIIVNRSLNTSLTVNDGETVLLGGLISKNTSTTDSGVPLLMDIPYIGSVFQSQSKKTVKTELVILIKPNILQTPKKLTDLTHKFTSVMKMLHKYSSL